MSISFLTPRAAFLGLAVVVPLLAFGLVELRAARIRARLGLGGPSPLTRLPLVLALALVVALVAAAGAQPIVQRSQTRYTRTDAGVFIVIDTSRSMLASEGPNQPRRFARAKRAALALRSAIPDVPVGLASITDRVLPHIFPTAEADPFKAALDRSIGIERPPPSSAAEIRSTDFGALSSLANQNFFQRGAKRRLVIVLTDGETIPVTATYLRDLYRAGPDIHTIFLRFWSDTERVYGPTGKPEPRYRPDQTSGAQLERIVSTINGRLLSEHQLAAAIRAERNFVGQGKRVKLRSERRPMRLAPYTLLAAFVPLGFLLWRRNL